ncbi:MAG: gluconate 2-dehydrogenase subunit 3 family protein [Saprospiraceae bacterium]|nr:gluconate 2-dehydrogenase subunit 3 family protein [Saprospiraceae bacterium]
MNRREALEALAIMSAGTFFLGGCADRPAEELIVNGRFVPDKRHLEYLTKISEAILPLHDIKERVGEPAAYILTMMNDCRSTEQVAQFVAGFEEYKLLMQSQYQKLRKAAPAEIIDLMQEQLASAEISGALEYFVVSMRSLSIDHLRSSELYMADMHEYKLVPDPYSPCAPV